MEKALEILKHIEELYSAEPDIKKIELMASKNPERVEAWQRAFNDFDLTDVLDAIDEFWQFKSSKSRPNVAQLLAILNTKNTPKAKQAEESSVKYTSPAQHLMSMDIATGDCRHLLPIYEQTVDYILSDLLLTEIPVSEWRNMDFNQRYNQAVDKGLFSGYRQILEDICLKTKGKKTQFPSENDLIAMGQIALSDYEDAPLKVTVKKVV